MGKTEALLCILGHRMADGPRVQSLIVQPTQDLARSFGGDRIEKLLRNTPALEKITDWGRMNKLTEKYVGGLRCNVAWAGSATQLSSISVGLCLLDEIDRMERDVSGEGDPVTLARARTKNFARSLMMLTSTPTIEDDSPIQAHFDDATREFFEWQCPHCVGWFRPQSKHIVWPKDSNPAEAFDLGGLYCPNCGAQIDETRKPALNRAGQYCRYARESDGTYTREPGPTAGEAYRSFWVSGICSPWMSIANLARNLCASYRSHDPLRIQACINTDFGEVWTAYGDAPEWKEVFALSRPYAPLDIPNGCLRLTMGVDVQKDGLFYVIRGWGVNMSSWLIQNGYLEGHSAYDDVWLKLSQLLGTPVKTLNIERCFVDRGYRPFDEGYRRPDHMVDTFCMRHHGIAHPIAGKDAQDKIYKSSAITAHVDGTTIKDGLHLWTVDTDKLKTWLHMRIRWPEDAPSGQWLLHRDVDEDYCRQIVSERVVETSSGKRKWEKPRRRANHYLDCEVYALSAAMSLHYENIQAPNVRTAAPEHRTAPRESKFARRGL